jgi:hypothetical protein
MTNQVKIKVTDSTSTVPFNNTAHAFYDMIIAIQNVSVSQTISIYDVEGNLINDKPLTFGYPVKIILKDVPLGSISFEDVNVYSVILSYVIKSNPGGIPYIDFINETSVHPSISTNSEYSGTFTGSTTINYSTLLANAGVTDTDSVILIKSIYYSYTSSATGTYDNILGIYEGFFTKLTDFFSVSVTTGDVYDISINQSVYQYSTGQSDGIQNILIPLPSPIILRDGHDLSINDGETTNVTEIVISYEVLS